MDIGFTRRLAKLYEEGRAAVFCLVVEEVGSTPRSMGSPMLVYPDGSIEGSVGGGITEKNVIDRALKLLRHGTGSILYKETLAASEAALDGAACGGAMSVYLEVVGRTRDLLIFGAGHVGRALAQAGHTAGFAVTTWDDREEFANGTNIPWGNAVCCPLEEAMEHLPEFHGGTYAVVVTRGHAQDADVIKLLEGRPAAYMGMIGSRKKIAFVRERLLAQGVSEAHMDRIYQPVGLPIKAETPEEIAVSIVAELIAVARGGDLESLRSGLKRDPLAKEQEQGIL